MPPLAERKAVFVEEVLLLEPDPQVGVVFDRGARVCGMRRAIGVHDFAENEIRVRAGSIRIQSHRFQHTVGAFALRLHSGTAVETPIGQIGKGGGMLKGLEQTLAAQSGNGRFAVKPDVFEFVFGHGFLDSPEIYGIARTLVRVKQDCNITQPDEISIMEDGAPCRQAFQPN